MDIKLYINNDKLSCPNFFTVYTGNVGTYRCVFDIKSALTDASWFCVFKQGEKVYSTVIEGNACVIPHEVLESNEPLYIGCYGVSSAESDHKRISTNWITAHIENGAYSEAAAPETPSPDVWETLVSKTVPIIGENGNWFIYDMNKGDYVDSGVSASGSGGGTRLTAEQLKNIDKIPGIEKAANNAVQRANFANDIASQALSDASSVKNSLDSIQVEATYAKNQAEAANTTANQKQDKVNIIDRELEVIMFFFAEMNNSELRNIADSPVNVELIFGDGVYEEDYTAGLSFNSGDTPTTIIYTDSGILNWVGTDCTTSDGLSIFQPSANTHYDIVFYFNGVQMIGLVNGFVPASGNEAV